MYDNHSTDDSVSIARKFGMEVRTFGTEGVLNDGDYVKVKNHCWKEAKGEADFVIVCDADEFLFCNDLIERLNEYKVKGVTLPRTQGYQMVSKELPENLIFDIDTGFRFSKFSKPIIFDPNKIEEINFNYGSHNHKPVGIIKRSWRKVGLYHFRMIGGYERLKERHIEYLDRLSDFNRERRFGKEYWKEENQKRKDWERDISKARKIRFK